MFEHCEFGFLYSKNSMQFEFMPRLTCLTIMEGFIFHLLLAGIFAMIRHFLRKLPQASSLVERQFSTASVLSPLGGSGRGRSTGSCMRMSLPDDFVKWASLGFCRGSRFATGFQPLQPKPLDTIMDIERVKSRSAEDIVSIWDDYHLGRGHIGASMKGKLYGLLEHKAGPCRYFVIPLWKESGYTSMFLQVQMPHMLFTGLEDYKAKGTQAAPYFIVTYYPEFAESKDLVLIRGDVVFTSKLSDEEARWLLETAQSFYLNDTRYKLVEQFNKRTHEFEFKNVLRALDMPLG